MPQPYMLCRKQEEDTLKMAIELSKSEASATDDSHDNNTFGDSSTGVIGNVTFIVIYCGDHVITLHVM